jgi:Holliday junction resolvase RusA-like endonuclease
MLTITIPVPPSANNMFINVPKRGRVKSTEYRKWRDAAGWFIQSQPHPKVPGKVNILIEVRRGRGDIDNRVKPVLDLLVLHHLIDDDRNVQSVTARWADVDSCRVTVTAFEAEAA